MASYNELNALIDAYINRNGVQAITGQILNGVLKAMVEQLGRGYTIMGAAIPTTDPGTPDAPESYFASQAGTYTKFGGIAVASTELCLLCYTPGAGWDKRELFPGIQSVNASIDEEIPFPSVDVTYNNGVLSFDFHSIIGEKGDPGIPADISDVFAQVDANIGTPSVDVTIDGPSTGREIYFKFHNLKGETGVTSVLATVDNTVGTPQCAVSLVGQQLTLAFSGLKGAQGDTGVSADYPIAIVNNLTTNDPASALSAAQGVVLDGKVTQLEAKVTDLSAEEVLDLDEEIKVLSEDGQTTILEITEDGVDAKDLKSNGVPVLTSHQDISGLATKTELEEGLAGKQDVIEEISVDDTHNSEDSEQIFASNDYDEDLGTGELYAKIDGNGIHAKGFFLLDGSPVAKDSLFGKKWAVLGDSFTAGDGVGTFPDGKYAGKPKTYPYLISLRTGIELYNFFGGGRTLAFPAVPGDFVNSVTNPTRTFYYQNIPADTDIITIYLGINDSHHAPGSGGGDGEDNTGVIPIGTITDNTTATYYGAWNVVLSWLIENRPFAHIGIIVSNGCDTDEYRTAQIAIARKYGIPFIDLNGDDRTPFMLRARNTNIPSSIRTLRIQKQAVDYDGTKTGSVNLHPNEDAHLFESTFIENFLRTI